MEGMSIIVKKVAQLLAGLIFMYGVYIILHGHLTPGGGFAGGIIVAGAFILLILAFGSSALNLKKEVTGSSNTESIAILMVVILALMAMLLGTRVFLFNFLPKGQAGELVSAGVIPLYNIFIGIEVAGAILTIFLALVIFKEESSK
ncbi:MAG: MnhB domain-containing protein [Bacteroidota bacterium]|nr:MnhB domain-containing protein [Bacteroidota bacterium]